TERRPRHVGAAVVPAVVARVLDLFLKHADDEKRRASEEDGLADRGSLAEDLVGDLVAQKEDAALLLRVERIDEAAARLGNQVAHGAELGSDARSVDRDRLQTVMKLQGVRVLR